jgi:membrane protein implicated in regulation of membrane protease activity
MEWIIGLLCIVLAARYGEQGLTGGLVVVAAALALLAGISLASQTLTGLAVAALLAMAAAFVQSLRTEPNDSSIANRNTDQP